jgi:hypothetical protein
MPLEDRKYLLIPFEKKDKLKKQFGLRWDINRKLWYISKDKYGFGEIDNYEIINLEVPFKHKDYVKGLGCRWNGNNWFTTMEVYEKYKTQFSKYEIYGNTEEEALEEYCNKLWLEECD